MSDIVIDASGSEDDGSGVMIDASGSTNAINRVDLSSIAREKSKSHTIIRQKPKNQEGDNSSGKKATISPKPPVNTPEKGKRTKKDASAKKGNFIVPRFFLE